MRQCGKTYLLRTYAQDLSNRLSTLILRTTGRRERIFRAVLTSFDRTRDRGSYGTTYRAWQTLLFIDEIQACEEALTSLKYFCEDAPEYYIAAAGSLLGLPLTISRIRSPSERPT